MKVNSSIKTDWQNFVKYFVEGITTNVKYTDNLRNKFISFQNSTRLSEICGKVKLHSKRLLTAFFYIRFLFFLRIT
jgi:hypothetical protein